MPASVKSFGVVLSALVSAVFAQSTSEAEQVSQLRLAPTEVDRIKLLADSDLVFNFLAPPSGVTAGSGGYTVAATSENFPAVVGKGVSMTVGFLGPCGMNSPHTHPRATEMNFSLNTTLRAGILVENGARFIDLEMTPGKAAVFPQGSIHYEMNPTCQPAMFVAGFNNEDPGVSQVAQRYFGLPPDIVAASLGGLDVVEVAGLESLIPDDVIYGVDECLQRCGILRSEQPTDQREPRNSANALPTDFSAPTAVVGDTAIPTQTLRKVTFMDSMTHSSEPPVVATAAAAAELVDNSPLDFDKGPSLDDDYFLVDKYTAPLISSLVALNIAIFVAVTVGITYILLGSRRREKFSPYRPFILPGMIYEKASPDALESGESTAYTSYNDSPMSSPGKVL